MELGSKKIEKPVYLSSITILRLGWRLRAPSLQFTTSRILEYLRKVPQAVVVVVLRKWLCTGGVARHVPPFARTKHAPNSAPSQHERFCKSVTRTCPQYCVATSESCLLGVGSAVVVRLCSPCSLLHFTASVGTTPYFHHRKLRSSHT
jgi:hypothetical protein